MGGGRFGKEGQFEGPWSQRSTWVISSWWKKALEIERIGARSGGLPLLSGTRSCDFQVTAGIVDVLISQPPEIPPAEQVT